MTGRCLTRAALLAALLVGTPRAARAQLPVADSAARQSPAAAESLPPPVRLPHLPLEVAPGPLPPGSRLVFTRDSLTWAAGYTLADLLSEVPGLYVGHTGFFGQPALALYGGRGGTALELFRDGVPVLPLGTDSVVVDPGRISLFGLRRVEVERLPGRLRVFLVSERTEDVGTRSALRVVTGDFKTGGYAGLFQRRWASGLGMDLVADYFDTQGDRQPRRNARWFELGARADWAPSPRLSASATLRRGGFSRDPTAANRGVALPGRDETRTEMLVRVTAAQRPERRGLALELGLHTTSWRADSGTADTVVGNRTVHRAFAGVGLRTRDATAELTASAADHYTPIGATARLAWSPVPGIVLASDGAWERHEGGRRSLRGHAALGLHAGPLSLVGAVAAADAVPAPMLPDDTARVTLDLSGRLGFATRRVTVHAGVERRDGFAVPPVPSLPPFAALPLSPAATYALGDAALNLGAWSVTGWYAHPVQGVAAAFEPPNHARVALTFRSKFWRTFRSGAFDLKAQLAVETWGDGVAGLDATGTPIALPRATIADAFLQIQLVQFRAFYSLRNAFRSEEWYVPEFRLFRVVQTFGVKWEFNN